MSDSESPDHSTKIARIQEVAMTVHDPKNAGEIAEVAGVARNTAEKYLSHLVETNTLETIQHGRETRYYPDPVTQYFDQIRELVTEHGKDELSAELGAIRDDIDGWKDRYDVASADELRSSVGNDMSATERTQRRHDAEDWEYFEHRATLIKQAIHLYDTIESTKQRRVAFAN